MLFMVGWFSCGCVTGAGIYEAAERVYLNDGISKKEAVWLARKDCLQDPECASVSSLSLASLTQDKQYPGEWLVRFSSDATHYKRVIRVHKVTGTLTRGYYSWWQYYWNKD